MMITDILLSYCNLVMSFQILANHVGSRTYVYHGQPRFATVKPDDYLPDS